jgi:putative intracellular protease/amidase
MPLTLQEVRAFAVRQRLDVIFQVRATTAAWMVNRHGVVVRAPIGDATIAGVEETLAAADAFIVEGDAAPRQHLSREQLLALMAARAGTAGVAREKDDG